MGWLIAIIVGAIVGLLSYYGTEITNRMSVLVNLIVGIIGGLLGAWFFMVVLNLSTTNPGVNFWLQILWALIGAVILIAIADSISSSRRVSARRGRTPARKVAHEYKEEETQVSKKKRKK